MTKLLHSFLALSLIFFPVGSVQAAPAKTGVYKTGNQLYENCTVTEKSPTYWQDNAACISYVIGVVDGIGAAEYINKSMPVMCIPMAVEAGQMADIVRIYLRDHPETRHLAASGRVMLALSASFPCTE